VLLQVVEKVSLDRLSPLGLEGDCPLIGLSASGGGREVFLNRLSPSGVGVG
jgi:hypothetical protein